MAAGRYFWSDRFKSVIVENGETLINCLAYIDLNPVRAGIVEKPEDYRWSSLGYHIQTGNEKKVFAANEKYPAHAHQKYPAGNLSQPSINNVC
jgi:hypothetical protein